MTHVVVVGAGITGLTTAFRLATAGDRAPKITVLDADHRVGGKIRTHREDGVVFDGGADAFIANRPEAKALCEDLGLGDRLLETRVENRRVFVRHEGELVAFPEGVVLTVPTELGPLVKSPLFTLGGIARMGLDLVLPRGGDDHEETISEFMSRRFGRELVEKLAEPLLGGIYVGDPNKLSMRATFPQLIELERNHRSLVLGAMRTRPKKAGPPKSAFYALRNGMAELPETLAAKLEALGVAVRLGVAVDRVEKRGESFRLSLREGESTSELDADWVVLAVPAKHAEPLVRPLTSAAADALHEVPYVSSATCLLAFPASAVTHPLDAVGVLMPKTSPDRALALTFVTSKWPSRAPEGTVVFRVFFGGYSREADVDLEDDALVKLATSELRKIVGVRGEPRLAKVFRYVKANPQPIVGHLDRMKRVREEARAVGRLLLGGGAYDGVGIPDCVRQANAMATRILEDASAQ